jgi:hypothetical protein
MAERDQLMRAVQAARTGDKLAIAVAALDAHDRRRTASLQQSRETDMSATAVRATLEPLPAFEQHTAATDWLGEYEAPSDYRTAMIAEASKWYRGIPRDLMADPDEFNEQALGHAYTAASAYGPHALAARREFMTYVGYLTRSGASGLPQIQQTEDPKDNPAATPLPPEAFDNFAPEQNEYNTGPESPNGQSQVSSEQAPMIQQVQQMDGSGSGFGSGPERPDEHSTAMDTSNSYAEVPLGPPGEIPTAPPGAAPPAPSAPNPAMGQQMDEGAPPRPTAERQASLRFSAYTGPDQDGFRWHIGSDQDVDTLDTPYHERCSSLHWPEQDCSHGNAHTASVAVGYLMSVEDFHRRAYFESQGSAEGTAVLRAAGGDLKRLARHHGAVAEGFRAEARTEDEIAWLHGYLARVRPVLAGGKDPFGGKAAKPFGEDEDVPDDGKKKKRKKKGKPWDKTGGIPPGRLPNFPEPRQGQLRKGAPFAGYKDFAACVAANQDKRDPEAYCGKIKHQVEGQRRTAQAEDEDQPRHYWDTYSELHRQENEKHDQGPPEPAAYDRQHEGSRRTAQERPFSTEPGVNWGDDNDDLWQPHVRPHMRGSFRELWQIDPDAGERQPTDEDRRRFEHHVRSNYPQDIADAYFHQHQGTRKTAGAKCACGEDADGTCAVCDKPVCDEHSTMHDHDRFCRKHAGSHEAASQLPQIQQTVDPDNVPTPQADQLPTDVMFPLNPGWVSGQAPDGEQSKEAARSSMAISGSAARMFGHLDAMDGKPPHHKDRYAFSNKAHGQYIRGYATTRGVLDGYSDRDPMSKADFHGRTGRGDLHGHYLDAFHEARGRKGGSDPGAAAREDLGYSGGTQATSSLRRQADIMTKPHETTDDGNPPFNTAQTSPEPWSSNEGSGDYSQGVKDGQEDAAAGEHPTFSDNSSRVSPYVQGYSAGYGGRPAAPGQQDVPRSMGGDSGQAGNAADAQRQFQVSHASLQRTAACLGCPHPPHLGQPCNAEGCRHLHNPGEEGGGPGQHARTIGHEPDPDHPGYSRPRGSGRQGMRVSAAFVTPEAVREPDFAKGYKYAARWQPGMLLVQQGSPAFEAGLYAAIADRPAVQRAWADEHYRLSRKFPVLGARLDAHSGFTVKFARAHPRRYAISASGYLVPAVRRTAATSVDLITDGPGASPDPMGSTPLNGPGQPPPMGGGEDPARSGGVPPYQGAPPPAAAPVAPDDVLGTPQEPPQPGGPFTQTFSGRHPDNQTLAPVAPDTADQSGYRNEDAYQGDPMHKPQAMAFRRRVQANLAASRAS